MNATVTILEQNFDVEYDFDITASGSIGAAPSMNYPGDPDEPAEFDIEVLGIASSAKPDIELELPSWLRDLLTTHLYERQDIHDIVQQADRDRGCDYDY